LQQSLRPPPLTAIITMTVFAFWFAAFLAFSVLARGWLSARQRRHVLANRDAVPAVFGQKIALSAHQRAADYTVAKIGLARVELLLSTLIVLALTFGGVLTAMHQQMLSWLPEAPLLRQIATVVAVIALTSLIDFPLSLYRQFRLEQRFGFNRMTLRLFLLDALKGTLIGAAIGLPMLAAVLSLMASAGANWWLWAWALSMAFNLSILVLYPTVIAPLFNKFLPLEPGAVRDRIEQLLQRCGFSSAGLFVMDGSKRSAHGNAYFTGFGKAKRIVFFDTLLAKLAPGELEAVLAHELGHFKHRHIIKRIVFSFAGSLLGLVLLGYLARQDWFYAALGASRHAQDWPALSLILFFLVVPTFLFPLKPLFSMMSRRQEFQADTFAAEQTDADQLVGALVKLYEDNASTLTPDPVHSAVYDSHPPAAQRIAHLAGLRKLSGPIPTGS
jgi:STE24 endopeptidase